MKRLLYGMLALILLALPARAAQGQVLDGNWEARYWNNTTRSGLPAVIRTETEINFPNTTGSFVPGINADKFSARFEKYIEVSAGNYRFTVTADDGVRVLVNNSAIIDKMFDQPATTYTADITLPTGAHRVVVEYYENTGGARLQFSYGPAPAAPPAPPSGPWDVAYWNNTNLSGSPVALPTAAEVNFDWGEGSPMAGVNKDNFSARFTRTYRFDPGTYRFTATMDDGMRVWVAGKLVIDQWKTQAVTTRTADVSIAGGNTEIKVEYFDAGGRAVAKLRWERVGDVGQGGGAGGGVNTGEILVDDGGSGWVTGGSASGFRTTNGGTGGRFTWTQNNRTEQPNYNWARWYPRLTAGRYEVQVYIPTSYNSTTNAGYWVAHRDGYTQVNINQSTNGGRWISLGTYNFRGTDADYVSLNDITGEAALSRYIAFDAVKFVAR